MRRTTTCACHLVPKILIPFQVKNDVLFYFAIINALCVVYCIGGILFEKKIGSGNWSKHEMWNQTMNNEEKVEACKTLNPNTQGAQSSIFALEAGAQACYFRNSLLQEGCMA
jgi:hypothetical protein